MLAAQRFTTHAARSIPLVAGLSMVIVVETVAFHLLVSRWQPAVAWLLTLASAASLVWLVRDDRAFARLPVELDGEALTVRSGRRFAVRVPLGQVAEVRELTWRDLPKRAPGYLKGSGFATPNVLLRFTSPVAVAVFGVPRQMSAVGLRLDDPAGFVAAVQTAAERA